MTKEHLTRIVNSIENLQITQEEFDSLYTTNRNGLPIISHAVKSCLLFDFEKNEMTFKNGRIGPFGLFLEFKHLQFPDISVQVLFDYSTRKIYNSVLATPQYTKKDWEGKKRISQTASKVKSDKDLQKLFSRLKSRFECPVLD